MPPAARVVETRDNHHSDAGRYIFSIFDETSRESRGEGRPQSDPSGPVYGQGRLHFALWGRRMGFVWCADFYPVKEARLSTRCGPFLFPGPFNCCGVHRRQSPTTRDRQLKHEGTCSSYLKEISYSSAGKKSQFSQKKSWKEITSFYYYHSQSQAAHERFTVARTAIVAMAHGR